MQLFIAWYNFLKGSVLQSDDEKQKKLLDENNNILINFCYFKSELSNFSLVVVLSNQKPLDDYFATNVKCKCNKYFWDRPLMCGNVSTFIFANFTFKL